MNASQRTPPAIVLLGLVALGLVIGFGLPLVPGVRGTVWTSPLARAAIAGLLVLGWLMVFGARIWMQRRRTRRLMRVLLTSADLLPGDPFLVKGKARNANSWWQRRHHAVSSHDHQLRARTFSEATAAWGSQEQRRVEEREHFKGIAWSARRVGADNGRKRALDDLPWLLVIGANGAGKSTFIERAGLPFPIAEIQAQNPIAGAGASYDCRWWFHQDVVVIQTPGRFFSQDSIAETDAEDWETLLQLLGGLPPKTPVRAILLLVSAESLVDTERATRESDQVRHRLIEASEHLGADVPVYLVLTHLDRIAGFSEYFEHSTPDYRHQAWALPLNPEDQTSTGLTQQVQQGWNGLLDRLDAGLLEQLQAEDALPKHHAQFAFFDQVAAFEPLVTAFVARSFKTGGVGEPDRTILAGICLTSAAQTPAAWDWVTPTTARHFGLKGALQVVNPEFPRGYFVRGVIHQFVISRTHSTTRTSRQSRGNRRLRRSAIALLILTSLLTLGSWGYNTITNQGLIATLKTETTTAQQHLAQLPSESPLPTDLIPALDALAAAVAVFPAYAPLPLRTGLYQGPELLFAAHAAYQRTLRIQLLPALTRDLASSLAPNQLTARQRRQALTLYRVLDDPQQIDREAFTAWFSMRWQAIDPTMATALGKHLKTLMTLRLPPQQIDYSLLSRRR